MKLLVALAFASVFVHAEVVDSSASGFTVRTTLIIKASPQDIYRRFMHNIGEWWNPQHTFSGDARNLTIDERPGGCLCEKLADNGFSRHMEIITALPGKRIVMRGALGPLQTLAATCTLQIQMNTAEEGTKFEATYSVHGYLPNGMNTFAAPVDMVTAEQFTRLKNYVETGKPVVSK